MSALHPAAMSVLCKRELGECEQGKTWIGNPVTLPSRSCDTARDDEKGRNDGIEADDGRALRAHRLGQRDQW